MQHVQQKLEDLENDGICYFEDVLDEHQIALLRQQLLTHLEGSGRLYNGGNTQNDAINVIDGIQWIVNKTLLADIVRTVIGDDAQYVHHSDVLHNTFTGWHRDCLAHANSGTPLNFWPENDSEPYKVYKFAFYLEDHRRDKTALKYVAGSHKSPTLRGGILGRIYHYFVYDTMQPAPGALVVFDQRLYHNGVTPSLLTKLLQKMVSNTETKQKLWDFERRIRGMQDRVFIQIAFGASGEYSNQHAKEMIDRQQQKIGRPVYEMSEHLKANLTACGIGLADLNDQPCEPVEAAEVVTAS